MQRVASKVGLSRLACLVRVMLEICLLGGMASARGDERDTVDMAEEPLQAIRWSMVEAALHAETRVQATSWLDGQGGLHESTRFTSQVRVRDLMVQAASRPSEGCEAEPARSSLLQVMRLEQTLSPELTLQARYQAQLVGRLASRRLMALAERAGHWRVMTDTAFTRPYDRLMYGHGEEHVHWWLQLTVRPTFYSSSHDVAPFTLLWRVWAPGQETPWLEVQRDILPARSTVNGVTPTIDRDMSHSIDHAVQALVRQLDQRLACEPQPFPVRTQSGERWHVDAGRSAGLQVGDRVLLVDAQVLPAHALEDGALDAVLLAEVKAVSTYEAELQPVASPVTDPRSAPVNPSGQWVVWPFTYGPQAFTHR